MIIKSFSDVENVLASKRPDINVVNWFFALDDMRVLMESLDNPQDIPSTIHVAGTSGKTSTCYYLAEFFRLAGLKTGLTVSPHVTNVGERLQINGARLPDNDYFALFQKFITLPEIKATDITYFGLLVAFAYWAMAKKHVQYAVIEVGMGGRLDATNVIMNQNKICVITDIGLDHTKFLGNTLPEIAQEKAGIIQTGNHVFVAKQDDSVMEVFQKTCADKNATLHILPDGNIMQAPNGLPLFQQRNWALARFAFEYVTERDGLKVLSKDEEYLSSQLVIPARMQEYHYQEKIIILDVSHNSQKISALCHAIKQKYPSKNIPTLISMVEGKDISLPESLTALRTVSDQLFVTRFNKTQDMSRAAIDPALIKQVAHDVGFTKVTIIENPEDAFTELLRTADDTLLVTGSFFLINHIHPILEKNVNEGNI